MKSVEIDRGKRLRDQPTTGHNRFHPDIPPLVTVAEGEEVVLATRDGVDGQLGPAPPRPTWRRWKRAPSTRSRARCSSRARGPATCSRSSFSGTDVERRARGVRDQLTPTQFFDEPVVTYAVRE